MKENKTFKVFPWISHASNGWLKYSLTISAYF